MADENRDVATVFGDEYSRSVPGILGDQHRFLLEAVESHFLKNPDGTLLVVGPGGKVLPYSCTYTDNSKLGDTNRDRIKKMVGDGKIILMDYVMDKDKGGLEQGVSTLDSMGFFDEGYFQLGEFAPQFMNPESLEDRSISFLENNLRDTIRVTNGSIDVVEANLSVHHASVTRAELERVYKDFYRVMKPGGLLHLGEGNVDMNYSEGKLIRIGQDLSSILDAQVLISDNRDQDYMIESLFEPGQTYENLPVVQWNLETPRPFACAHIDGEGIVQVSSKLDNTLIGREDKSQLIREGLKNRGYITINTIGGISFPLIDPHMEEDKENFVYPIHRFYDAIFKRVVKGYSGVDDDLVVQIEEAIMVERSNAYRAIVEHYMGQQTIVDTLESVGFENVQVHRESEPFYNILATKHE